MAKGWSDAGPCHYERNWCLALGAQYFHNQTALGRKQATLRGKIPHPFARRTFSVEPFPWKTFPSPVCPQYTDDIPGAKGVAGRCDALGRRPPIGSPHSQVRVHDAPNHNTRKGGQGTRRSAHHRKQHTSGPMADGSTHGRHWEHRAGSVPCAGMHRG